MKEAEEKVELTEEQKEAFRKLVNKNIWYMFSGLGGAFLVGIGVCFMIGAILNGWVGNFIKGMVISAIGSNIMHFQFKKIR